MPVWRFIEAVDGLVFLWGGEKWGLLSGCPLCYCKVISPSQYKQFLCEGNTFPHLGTRSPSLSCGGTAPEFCRFHKTDLLPLPPLVENTNLGAVTSVHHRKWPLNVRYQLLVIYS